MSQRPSFPGQSVVVTETVSRCSVEWNCSSLSDRPVSVSSNNVCLQVMDTDWEKGS